MKLRSLACRRCDRRAKIRMNDAQCFVVFLILATLAMWLLYRTDYQRDFNRWDNILQKRNSLLSVAQPEVLDYDKDDDDGGDGDSDDVGGDPFLRSSSSNRQIAESSVEVDEVASADSSLAMAAVSSAADGWAQAPVKAKLGKCLANVEEDVFRLDVKLILRAISPVVLDENRLVHKLQNAQIHPKERCVIRITKYCGTRCLSFFGKQPNEWQQFSCSFASPCSIETRFVSRDLIDDVISSTDILIIISSLHESLKLQNLMARRPPGQLWMLYSRESPQHDPEYSPPDGVYNPYNLTMTYSRDADMYFPYCHTHPYPLRRVPPIPKKTKLIAWMASNCHRLSWRRNEFVSELRKHLAIDTYGKCGESGYLPDATATKTLQQYKFYLSLENSECNDYITEKAWRTPLPNGIVPIVYGASKRDYESILPNRSFIHLEDFTSMKSFVDYIHRLDGDNALYKRYFDWRTESQVVCHSARWFVMIAPDINFCYLIKKLVHVHLNPDTSWQRRFPDFKTWWQNSCSDPDVPKELLGFNIHEPKRKSKALRQKRSKH